MNSRKSKSEPKKRAPKKSVIQTPAQQETPRVPFKDYIKHLVECRCVLPQFKDLPSPVNHKFVVFSELNDFAEIVASYAQCNNCGIIHKVLEVGVSETIKKEESKALLETADEIATSLPLWLSDMLKKYECDLPTWQEARFIIQNEMWGRAVVLTKEREEDKIFGKICQILGQNLHKIESFEREE